MCCFQAKIKDRQVIETAPNSSQDSFAWDQPSHLCLQGSHAVIGHLVRIHDEYKTDTPVAGMKDNSRLSVIQEADLL
jgi:hypothetical protein